MPTNNNFKDYPTAARRRVLTTSGALAGLFAVAGAANAINFETGVPELTARLDTTLRYNLGFRADRIDPRIGNNPSFDESDYRFSKRGDIVTNRVDLLSELEVDYKQAYGFRVSGTAWYDHAYRDSTVRQNPALANLPSSYFNNRYSRLTKRFYRGSGEFLDAFVYGNFTVAGEPLSVRVGKHSLYWGNSLFSGAGIAYSQQPTDGRKAAATPGVEARETFLPLNQVSATYQISDTVQVAGQYFFDWDHVRSPEGGTFLGSSDSSLLGPDRVGGASPFLRADPLGPDKKRGNWGVNTKISPISWNGTSLGIYYREFDEKNGLWLLRNPADPTTYRPVFARGTKLIGLGLDATLGAVSVGGELSLRKGAGLNTFSFTPTNEGARGNVYHASINATSALPNSPLWDFGSVSAELTYDYLDKVTKNPDLFNSVDAVTAAGVKRCPLGVAAGCATKDAWGMTVRVGPSWSQVYPGVDLSVPLVFAAGLKGNTADFGGTNEGARSYSIGAEFDIRKKWLVTLTYADTRGKLVQNGTNALGPTYTGNGSGALTSDRGRVTLTVKTSF